MDAAGVGSGHGAVAAGGAGAEAGLGAGADSYRRAHYEKASVGRSRSDKLLGPYRNPREISPLLCPLLVSYDFLFICASVFDGWLIYRGERECFVCLSSVTQNTSLTNSSLKANT